MRLLVFAKAPVPGQVKTRLIPALGAAGAARLQRRLLQQALGIAVQSGLGPLELWCAPDCRHPFLQQSARACGCSLRVQVEGDLGARMHQALTAAGAHSLPAILMGADAPTLPPQALCALALALAQGTDVAVIPALDGGYVAIGLRIPAPELFQGMPWGSAQVLLETRQRARQQGLNWWQGNPCPDLDRPEDLATWPPALIGIAATAERDLP